MEKRHERPCPVCGDGSADATYKLTRDGYPDWLVGCFSASCRELGGMYLAEVGDALLGDRHAPKAEIVAAFIASGTARSTGSREAKPSAAALDGWERRLWANGRALAWLRARGLADATIRRAGIGYGEFHGRPPAFMLPVRNRRGGLLTLKERYWPEPWIERKSRTLAGRSSHLFPALGDERHVILCEGEFDALIAAQSLGRVAAVTPTSGTSLPDDLLEEFAHRRVAVIYDVGAEDLAERNAARLREAGAEAGPVALPLPRRGDDLNDWFATYGRTAADLRRVIRRARPNNKTRRTA